MSPLLETPSWPMKCGRNGSLHHSVPRRVRKICCIGAGYVGGPTCAVIANKNPDVDVTVVDLDVKRIAAWSSDDLPIYEPGLLEVVQQARDVQGNLFFSTDVDAAIDAADLIFVSVNTPTKTTGAGAGRASELAYVESAVRKIAEISNTDKIVVEKSTVPIHTADGIRDLLAATSRYNVNFDVLSNPEFLAEGTAVSDLLNPDRVLIGSLQTQSGFCAAAALADLYASWVPRDNILTMNVWSSELTKLAANAMLAQRISSINALSAICEATGADIDEVSHACGLDTRIGSRMLKASVGFGGSCFKKDVLSLAYISESLHLPEVAAYWRSIVDINEYQKDRFSRRIVKCLYNTLTNKKIAILGFAYKKDTGDTRESAATTIIRNLINEGAKVSIYDPCVTEEQILKEFKSGGPGPDMIADSITICNTAYDACDGAHAVAILTEWDEFSNKRTTSKIQTKNYHHISNTISQDEGHDSGVEIESPTECANQDAPRADSPILPEFHQPSSNVAHDKVTRTKLDWSRVADLMLRPMFVFDGRNVVDVPGLEQMGFRVESIGKAGTSTRYSPPGPPSIF